MRRGPLPWLGGLLALYLLVPLVALLARAPGDWQGAPGLGSALAVSAGTATVATALIVVFGVPLGYLLAHGRGWWREPLGVLVQLPLALPPLMSGIALLYLVGPYTALGRLTGGRLTDSLAGVVLAQTFVAAPFLVVAARSAFAAVDPTLDDVAATLGHRRRSRFVRVWLPLAAPGIAGGVLLAWLRAFGEFGATVVLAYHPTTLPVYTYVGFGSAGLPATVPPVVVGLALALAVLLAVRLRPRRRRTPVVLPVAAPPGARVAPPLSFALTGQVGGYTVDVQTAVPARHLALLGPSGAGKSLTLRLLAGLRPAVRGLVRLGDVDLARLPAEQRGIGYVPQDGGLLPHLPVWRQVCFGVDADPAVAAWWVRHLGLTDVLDRLPRQLSGGQRQRVALARALARDPAVLLLDEPLSGLDGPVRAELAAQLRQLQREAGATTVLVTHDASEAARLAEQVVVLADGRVLQAGPCAAVYRAPNTAAVARLLGAGPAHAGVVVGPDLVAAGSLELAADTGELAVGTAVHWCVRPERVRLGTGRYDGLVVDVVDLGTAYETRLRVEGGVELSAWTLDPPPAQAGQRCRFHLPAGHVMCWPVDFPRAGEPALRQQLLR